MPGSPRRGTRCVSTGLTQAIAAGRSAGIGSGQRCAVRPAALDGELPPSSPGALFGSGAGTEGGVRKFVEDNSRPLPLTSQIPARGRAVTPIALLAPPLPAQKLQDKNRSDRRLTDANSPRGGTRCVSTKLTEAIAAG